MSRRTILILVGLLLVGLGAWVFYQSRKAAQIEQATGEKQTLLETLFPFAVPGAGGGSGTGTDNEPAPGTETPGTEAPAAERRLMRVTDKLVAGYTIVVPPAPKTPATPAPRNSLTGINSRPFTTPSLAVGPCPWKPSAWD